VRAHQPALGQALSELHQRIDLEQRVITEAVRGGLDPPRVERGVELHARGRLGHRLAV
jgi:hypothetical protein